MTIALVSGQFASVSAGAVASFTVALPNNPATGNFVVVGVRAGGGGAVTVKDSVPNTYAATTKTPFTGSIARVGIYYLANVPVGATKTITVAGVNTSSEAWIAEFSAVLAASPFENDATANSGANSLTINTPTLLTTNNGDLVICVEGAGGTIGSATLPWLNIDIVQNGNDAAYQIQTSTGTATPNLSQSPSSAWSGIIAAFKPAVLAGIAAKQLIITKQSIHRAAYW